ncbi:MAG: hypothetical protein CHH17_11335 [Candidatus Fluviicola riflensis]|nr:MAG: hypothetical protein CHH17_11335 [Candidatus Fluviicola riflensis]
MPLISCLSISKTDCRMYSRNTCSNDNDCISFTHNYQVPEINMKRFFFLILLTISGSAFGQKIFNVYDSFTLELVDSVEVTTNKDKVESTTVAFGIYMVKNAKNGTQLTFTRSGYETQFFDCSNDENESHTIILDPSQALLKSYRAKLPYYKTQSSVTHEKKSENDPETATDLSEAEQIPKDSILTYVDSIPAFPGGQEALKKYLSENIRYPQQAIELNISGKIYLQFVISKTGVVSSVRVIKGINLPMDAEAYRVVKAMPDWTPGRLKGKAVNCYFNLPISFKMY